MLNRFKPLRAKRRMNQISPQQLRQINDEVPLRTKLAKRCGGKSILRDYKVYINGKPHILHTVTCLGGKDERTGEPANGQVLDMEHRIPKSLGGKTDEDNCYMTLRLSHREKHGEKIIRNSKPQLRWLK